MRQDGGKGTSWEASGRVQVRDDDGFTSNRDGEMWMDLG